MKLKIFILSFLFLFTSISWGQQQQTTLSAGPPPALNKLNLTIVGALGNNTYYYYIVTNYPIGSVVSNGFKINNAPNITASNYVRLNWGAMDGATSYDILRSTSPNLFTSGSSGSCSNCEVTATYTSTSYNDTTATLTLPYTLVAPVAASVQIRLDNRDHTTPYLNLSSIAGPTATFNIQLPVICVSGCSGGGGSPGGLTTAVQYNNAGAFGGDATNFNWDATNKVLGIGATPLNLSPIIPGTLEIFGDVLPTHISADDFATTVTFRKRGRTGDITNTPTSGAELGYNSFNGWNGSTYARGALAIAYTTENWTTIANGTKYAIYTTPIGTTNSGNLSGQFHDQGLDLGNAQDVGLQGNIIANTVCVTQGGTGCSTLGDILSRNSKATSFIGQDTTHSAILELQGLTSGEVALGVADIAGTAITYVLPSTNGVAGQVLSDSGVTACPTFAAGAPATCHLLTWINGVTTVASGTAAMGTGAIASATCDTVVTVAATGVVTTDTLTASFNGDPTAVTGYTPSTSGMLTIIPYPTAGDVNFKVCNNTSASITPGAITLNWRVSR